MLYWDLVVSHQTPKYRKETVLSSEKGRARFLFAHQMDIMVSTIDNGWIGAI
jgi:hypothetical protein